MSVGGGAVRLKAGYLEDAGRGIRCPRDGVTHRCELPTMGTGNGTWGSARAVHAFTHGDIS